MHKKLVLSLVAVGLTCSLAGCTTVTNDETSSPTNTYTVPTQSFTAFPEDAQIIADTYKEIKTDLYSNKGISIFSEDANGKPEEAIELALNEYPALSKIDTRGLISAEEQWEFYYMQIRVANNVTSTGGYSTFEVPIDAVEFTELGALIRGNKVTETHSQSGKSNTLSRDVEFLKVDGKWLQVTQIS